jgi:hypothetical protein
MRFLHTMRVNPSLETDWDKAAASVASFPARHGLKYIRIVYFFVSSG